MNKKDLGERPPCPECASINIYSRGLGWSCKDCGKEYRKNPIGNKKIIMNIQHPCPRCKSFRVSSRHSPPSWKCLDCGKFWVKFRVPRKQVQNLEHPCPNCKSVHVSNQSRKWRCLDCGKTWLKNPNIKSIRPEHPCPECGSIHIHSSALRWLCIDCNHSWRKQYRSQFMGIPEQNISVKVGEVKKLADK